MNILDIHTHHNKAEAIINCTPNTFHPTNGYFYSVGIHPWDISKDYQKEWNLLQEITVNPQVIAIGEAGLDKLINTDIKLQQKLFELQINLSEQLNKPLIIHAVRTSNELILLKKRFKPAMPWIIHGFRGNKNIATQLLEYDFYLSFGEKYQAEALTETPLNRMFIETDESGIDIHTLYNQVAYNLSLPENQFMKQIQQNIKEVFFNR